MDLANESKWKENLSNIYQRENHDILSILLTGRCLVISRKAWLRFAFGRIIEKKNNIKYKSENSLFCSILFYSILYPEKCVYSVDNSFYTNKHVLASRKFGSRAHKRKYKHKHKHKQTNKQCTRENFYKVPSSLQVLPIHHHHVPYHHHLRYPYPILVFVVVVR